MLSLSYEKGMQELIISEIIETIQTGVLLGLAKILRRIQET